MDNTLTTPARLSWRSFFTLMMLITPLSVAIMVAITDLGVRFNWALCGSWAPF
jgi:hypothetical protein